MKKDKTKKQVIGDIVFDAVIAIILVFLFVFFITPRFAGNHKSYGKYDGAIDSSSWMKNLPDSTYIQNINLPGTHDSASQFVKLAWFSKCQTRPIGQQLNEGYRYLDIRLAIDDKHDNRLKLMHGFCNCKTGNRRSAPVLYLDSVLNEVYAFLEANPSETVVFVVKKDHGEHSIVEFQNKLNEYVSANEKMWFTENRLPKLGEVRGKIVLAIRNENEAGLKNGGLETVWAQQGNHEIAEVAYELNTQKNGLKVYVEDRYKYDAKPKWTAFEQALAFTSENNDKNAVYINFLSTNGDTKFGHPIKYAIPLNKLFWKYEMKAGNRYGWVLLDYATLELAQKIYMTNF